MAYADLRGFLELVETKGELKNIVGASPDLEMSSITEVVQESTKEPKPLIIFNDTPGYTKGFRNLFGLLTSPWRLATTLGLPIDQLDRLSLVRNWHRKVRNMKLLPPKVVSSGPVLANVMTGDKIDLFKFPVPRYHELDTNPYFGTCHAVIQKDPDNGYVNLGTYRSMLVDRNRLALHALEGQHGSIIMNQKYFKRGQVMPVAVVLGLDPALWAASCQRLTGWGVSEYDYAGGIKGEPIEVIAGQYTGLPLPARAEIVVEGECHPDDFIDEGPFGEWSGYYGNFGLQKVPEPVIRIKAVYYRDNPIFTCELPAYPAHDTSRLTFGVMCAESLWQRLEADGMPGIKGVWCYSEAAGYMLFNVVSIEQMYAGHSRDVGLIAAQHPTIGRYTIIVEDDIDPTDIKQVIWALVSRCHPDTAIQILNRCRSTSADSALSMEEKKKYKTAPKPLVSSRAIIDACRDMSWKNEWYPVARISPELKKKTMEKWQKALSEII